MGKATSIILGDHFDHLIHQHVQSGRYATASEVVRDALRLFEQQQIALERLNDAVEEGYASGFVDDVDWAALEQRAERAALTTR